MDERDDETAPPAGDADLARALQGARAYLQTLPAFERRIAARAAEGTPVWQIAQETGVSDAAVARTLDGVLAAVTGRDVTQVETGGLGADTDPGVSGGYGDTGFGGLDTEQVPDNTEPEEA